MKRLLLAAVIGLGVLSIAGSAMAGGTSVVSVSASIPAKCAVDSGALTAAFGDVLTTPATPQTVAMVFRCTKGTAFSISGDAGLHGGTGNSFGYVNAGGADNIKYTYSGPYTGTGTGWGVANQITQNITLTLDQAQANLAAAGSYTDTLTFTITP